MPRTAVGAAPPSLTKREPITISQPLVRRRSQHARDIARVVLAVAVHADHVLVAEFVGQLVAGLHATAQAQVMGQGEHPGAGLPRQRHGLVNRAIVDHQHRDVSGKTSRTPRTTPAMAPSSL